jgi:hypothetical protein
MSKPTSPLPAKADEKENEARQRQLLGYLADLLERQLEKLRKYDLDGAVRLAEESQRVSEQVAREGLLERPCYASQKQKIQGLYQDVCLIIASQRQEVAEKLRQIREGIRTLARYAEQ